MAKAAVRAAGMGHFLPHRWEQEQTSSEERQSAGFLTSHALLSLHGCAQDLKDLCASVFIPFAGMAGGCSSFSFSFFFFTFLGCRGDMLVTLVTVSPELQSTGSKVRGK